MSGPVNKSRPSRGRGGAPRRGGKGSGRVPNRAQVQAMQARAAATVESSEPAEPIDEEYEDVVVGASLPTPAALPSERPGRSPRARSTAGQRGAAARRAPARTIARPVALTRAEEYQIIRGDMQRLLMTAGALFLLMIALLVIVE